VTTLPGLAPPPGVRRSARLSECGTYRYRLERHWGDVGEATSRAATFIMLNPSTADATVDDRTIGRCMAFARSWDCTGLVVVNLYALRSTDPKGLWLVEDPVGPANDNELARTLRGAALRDAPVVAAWGANARPDRVEQFLALRYADRLTCLGTTKAGAPRHPLYVRGDTPLTPFAVTPAG
jgi:hypothetical protein